MEPLALPLSAGRVPVRAARRGERAARQARPRVRAARHRGLRRRPLLDRRGRLRQGRPARPAADGADHERRPRGRHAPRPADRLVPQHVGLGRRRRREAGAARATGRAVATEHPFLGPLELVADAGPDGSRPSCSSATTRRTTSGSSASPRPPVPEGRDQRPRRRRRRHRQPGRDAGTKAAFWYRVDGRRRARPSSCALRLRPAGATRDPWADFDDVTAARRRAKPTSSTPS